MTKKGMVPRAVSADAQWGDGVGCDRRGFTIYPPECVHMSPPCNECSSKGRVWSQFDPERGSMKRVERHPMEHEKKLPEDARKNPRLRNIIDRILENQDEMDRRLKELQKDQQKLMRDLSEGLKQGSRGGGISI